MFKIFLGLILNNEIISSISISFFKTVFTIPNVLSSPIIPNLALAKEHFLLSVSIGLWLDEMASIVLFLILLII